MPTSADIKPQGGPGGEKKQTTFQKSQTGVICRETEILGKKATKDIEKGTPLSWSLILL